jgi:hypothetical protein
VFKQQLFYPCADDWGWIIFYNDLLGIYLRTGKIPMPEYNTEIPVSIFYSPAVLNTFSRGFAGKEKQSCMNNALGDWLIAKKDDFTRHVKEKKSIAHVEILFGGRAYNFSDLLHGIISKLAKVKVISIKNQREHDPNRKSSWGVRCLGYDPKRYNERKVFAPMSEDEKRNYPFISKEEYIKLKGIDHFVSDILVIAEGAGAFGVTIEYTLNEIFGILKEYNKPLPEKVYIYVNFCSTLAVIKAKNVCDKFGVELDFTCCGSAIKIEEKGIFPWLGYTDLPHLSEKSVTYKVLRVATAAISRNFSDQIVANRCSCGDVGDSLDDAYHYYLTLIIENLLLGIPLDKDIIPNNSKGLMRYWSDPKPLEDLYKIVDNMQKKHSIELKDFFGTPLLSVIYNRYDEINKVEIYQDLYSS